MKVKWICGIIWHGESLLQKTSLTNHDARQQRRRLHVFKRSTGDRVLWYQPGASQQMKLVRYLTWELLFDKKVLMNTKLCIFHECQLSVYTPVDVIFTKKTQRLTWVTTPNFRFQRLSVKVAPLSAYNSCLFGKGNTHIPMVFGAADIGCDLHAVRGGDQLSEVLLADPETSVFRVGCWLHSRQEDNITLAIVQPEQY